MVKLSDPGIQLMLAVLYEKETKKGKIRNCKETRKTKVLSNVEKFRFK